MNTKRKYTSGIFEMRDLSILIPSRNEMFLNKTVEDILRNKRGNTEILVGLDGNWPLEPLQDHPDVILLHYTTPIGQRAITNQLARLSKAKYVAKTDAHCAFDEGFDVKLMNDMQDDWTMVPIMKNLHAFDWVCTDGHARYQSPSGNCTECGKPTTMNVIWYAKPNPASKFYRFDKDLHFQYWREYKKRPQAKGDIAETMTIQGSFFLMTRDKYWDLEICDEQHGSWGQQGVEVACKTWLSGGRVVVNKKTWYAHMFRTQGADFGFPYENDSIDQARAYSKDLWLNNKWPKAKYDLKWLLDKFAPVPDWHEL